MKLLGRLIMFAVGGFLLYLSISSIIVNYQRIQSIGWENFFSADLWNALFAIATQALYVLCGLYAIFIGLRGKAGFIAFVAAAILAAIVVMKTINFINSPVEKTFQTIFDFVLSYIVPIGFFTGVILLLLGENKKA